MRPPLLEQTEAGAVPTAPSPPIFGRGANLNPPNRFEPILLTPDPDFPADELPDPRTQFFDDSSESLLNTNKSPDVCFAHGINVYRGCEHGCAYCFARPYHEYLGWSSGLDFETKIMVKKRAPQLLRKELTARRWQPQPVAMSGATDCYQPAERHFRLTRQCLEVFAELRHPVFIITKNALVTRDIDVLRELAKYQCIAVHVSVTTLDSDLAGKLEPRASRPAARLRAIQELSDAGIPVGVMVAPIIPGLTDHEMPAILEAAAKAGATRAGHVIVRLPFAVKDVFLQWLDDHVPNKKARIVDRLMSLHGGKLYDSDWGKRMRGEGIFAEQLSDLFKLATRKVGLNQENFSLSTEHFRRTEAGQLELF